MGLNQQGLRLVIRDAGNSHVAFHLLHISFELGPEGRILNIVNGSVKSAGSVGSHTASSGSQVRMVVDSVK